METIELFSRKVHKAAEQLVSLKKEKARLTAELVSQRQQLERLQRLDKENENLRKEREKIRSKLTKLQQKIEKIFAHQPVELTLLMEGIKNEEHPQ